MRRLPGAFKSWAGRSHDAIPASRVTAFNFQTLIRSVSGNRKNGLQDQYLGYLSTGRWFGREVAKRLSHLRLDPATHAAFLYNTGALETLQLFNAQGVPCVVNQIDPARTEEAILRTEREKWPGWQKSAGEIPDVYFDRLEQEWQAATAVVVNSEWSQEALIQQGVKADKIHVVPLAYEPAESIAALTRTFSIDQPLRVLWVGQVILRKGIQYLFEAARLLQAERIEFLVAGGIGISEQALATAPPNVKLVGSVPRLQTPDLFRNADVFVLPTLSDGFAITQLEAMTFGLPVITTLRCGRVVTDGVDGLITPPADSQSLAAAIYSLYRDRERLAAFSQAAVAKAKRFSLNHVAKQIHGMADKW